VLSFSATSSFPRYRTCALRSAILALPYSLYTDLLCRFPRLCRNLFDNSSVILQRLRLMGNLFCYGGWKGLFAYNMTVAPLRELRWLRREQFPKLHFRLKEIFGESLSIVKGSWASAG
jgi:hypothetical protein